MVFIFRIFNNRGVKFQGKNYEDIYNCYIEEEILV